MTGRRVRVTGDRFHPVVPPGAIYVGREAPHLKRSPYANPYRPTARTVESHAAAIERYRRHLRERPDLVAGIRADFAAGQDAACWCAEDLPCRADVVLAVARGEEP